ncbi:hypothetical protein BGZ57DRAFT_884992 [Hyaloscypha finlandica]|nr:hypothetical protein BGZ57DRAFT_884992 [Hyaloscypha finlandica]
MIVPLRYGMRVLAFSNRVSKLIVISRVYYLILQTQPFLQTSAILNDCQGLGINGSWITWNAQNLLWLPPDYRAFSSAISLSGSVVAIGCQSGKVFIIGFSLAILYSAIYQMQLPFFLI